MNEYQFSLKFSFEPPAAAIDVILERLGEGGCTDALAGIGEMGFINLDFTREASSAIEAIESAIADVKRAIPEAQLIEAKPDLEHLSSR